MHWYGKAEVALQRKIGHVTITAPDRQTALASLSQIDSEAAAALSASTGRPSPCLQALSTLVAYIAHPSVILLSHCSLSTASI